MKNFPFFLSIIVLSIFINVSNSYAYIGELEYIKEPSYARVEHEYPPVVDKYTSSYNRIGYSCVCPTGQKYFYDYEYNKGYCGTSPVCATKMVSQSRVTYINPVRNSRVDRIYQGIEEPCKTYYYKDGETQTYCRNGLVYSNRYFYNDRVRRKMLRPRAPITVYKPSSSVHLYNVGMQCPGGFVYIPSANMCASQNEPICRDNSY